MYVNNNQAGSIVTELMEDAWSVRNFLLNEKRKYARLSYRISVSNYTNGADENVNFYFHFIISNERWWVTFSEDYFADEKELIFQDDSENWGVKCSSYRRYAFSDLVKPMIQNKVDYYIEKLNVTEEENVYIWDTLPITEFEG